LKRHPKVNVFYGFWHSSETRSYNLLPMSMLTKVIVVVAIRKRG
jgi:hypothetical protein